MLLRLWEAGALVYTCGKMGWQFLYQLNTKTVGNPGIPLLDTKQTKQWKAEPQMDICISLIRIASFTVTERQPKCAPPYE